MKIKFKIQLILSAIMIALIPLVMSYGIFTRDKISTIDKQIKTTLKNTAVTISEDDYIKETLNQRTTDNHIQQYTKNLISSVEDVDIIVICDMTGEKYSHLDESQIGEIFVNPDKKEVLEDGTGYYSLMLGSMGETLRWFQPIMYNGEQVGFVMVGKYYSDILSINKDTKIRYLSLFIFTFVLSAIGAAIFANRTKKKMLDMEPEEIASLYTQKKILIDSVQDGIIALDENNKIKEINNSCYTLFENFSPEKIAEKLQRYIDNKESFKLKEFIIDNKKTFITLSYIRSANQYMGVLIILSDKENINKVAKEITGVDEVIRNLRVNIHEFKNNLHVILGLIQLKLYDEAKNYILKIQKVQEDNSIEFNQVNDYYIRALLISKKLRAKEKKVEFNLIDDSNMHEEHGIVDSKDLVTILGNLVENAFDACVADNCEEDNKSVEVRLYEDSHEIIMAVSDNGISIDEKLKEEIFKEGVSSKGNNRGIGLYLVKNRVELYNGEIELNQNETKKEFIIKILKDE